MPSPVARLITPAARHHRPCPNSPSCSASPLPDAAEEDDEDAFGGGGESRVDASIVEAEAAHAGLGLMRLANELSMLERAWMAEKDAAGAGAEAVPVRRALRHVTRECRSGRRSASVPLGWQIYEDIASS